MLGGQDLGLREQLAAATDAGVRAQRGELGLACGAGQQRLHDRLDLVQLQLQLQRAGIDVVLQHPERAAVVEQAREVGDDDHIVGLVAVRGLQRAHRRAQRLGVAAAVEPLLVGDGGVVVPGASRRAGDREVALGDLGELGRALGGLAAPGEPLGLDLEQRGGDVGVVTGLVQPALGLVVEAAVERDPGPQRGGALLVVAARRREHLLRELRRARGISEAAIDQRHAQAELRGSVLDHRAELGLRLGGLAEPRVGLAERQAELRLTLGLAADRQQHALGIAEDRVARRTRRRHHQVHHLVLTPFHHGGKK